MEDVQLGLIEVARRRRDAGSPDVEHRPCSRAAPTCTAARRGRSSISKTSSDHDITFGIGPAGTGKTYLAVASAVDALEREQVKRIVLTRPAVEAGERLGFLPGDLAPEGRPLPAPALRRALRPRGLRQGAASIERGTIEIAPLAYMRGRTLNHSFIILDEAQNTTPEQMKMFLTRIGFGTKAVVTGDVTQIDLARGQKSGLVAAHDILARLRGIAFTQFTAEDVVRNPLVQRIVNAYERTSATRTPRLRLGMRRAPSREPRSSTRCRARVCRRERASRRGRASALVRPARRHAADRGRGRGRALNRDYRGKDYATNVLTFAYAARAARRRHRALRAGGRARGAHSVRSRPTPTTPTSPCTARCTCRARPRARRGMRR